MFGNQADGLIRLILASLGTFIVSHGIMPSATWDWLAGGAVLAVPAIWTWMKNRPASIAANAQGVVGVTVNTDASASAAVKSAVRIAKTQ